MSGTTDASRAVAGAPSGNRRLLSLAGDSRPPTLRAHRDHHPAPVRHRGSPDLIEMVSAAGLRGRGGAGFPTAIKMRAVADRRGKPVVVVNGTEGEPTSRKDKTLLRLQPHLVLDGALHAALAIGADEVLVCIDRHSTAAIDSVLAALTERDRDDPVGPTVSVLGTPPRYVVGEETALIHWINGGEARPTATPPRPFEKGVDGRPTLVDNVETLAHLAQIARYGPDWFRELGTANEPGTALATLTGAVDNRSVFEVPIGTRVAELLRAGGTPQGVGAVLVGGYFGSWLSPLEAAQAQLSDESLRPLGGGLGCAAVVVLPADGCGVAETARVLHWMAGETAGQCGPCVHGLHAIAAGFDQVARGVAPSHQVALLQRWASEVDGRGACRFPDGAIRFLRSALNVFADDLHRHAAGYPCATADRAPLLPIPRQEGSWR